MLLVALRRTSFTTCIGHATVIPMHHGILEEKKKRKRKIVSHNASFLPSFQYLNALICNILIFGIIFDYDFLQVSINLLWPVSVTKRSQNRPSDCIQVSETSELPGAPPPGPHQGLYGGPLDPTQIYAPLASLATL